MLPCSAAACSPRLPRPLAGQTHPQLACRTLQKQEPDTEAAVVVAVPCHLGLEATKAALRQPELGVELPDDPTFTADDIDSEVYSASDGDDDDRQDGEDDDDEEDAGSEGGGGGGAIAGAAAVVQVPEVFVISDDDEMEAAPAAGALSFVASLHRPLRPANPPLPALAPAVRSSASLPVCVQSGNVAAADTSTTRNVL